ncbi:MAG: cytochrome c [Hyphomicrobiaceae bacterium]
MRTLLSGLSRPAAVLRVAIVVALGVAATPASADTAEKQKAYGKHLSGECTTCHRIDGTDNGIPSIIGWPADAFVAVLISYRDGERTNQAMISVAKSLEEDQMAALAAYFGSLGQ